MENKTLLWTLVFLLVVGLSLLIGAVAFAKTTERQVIVKEPQIVEVVKYLPTPEPVTRDAAELDRAKSDFLKEVDETSSLQRCDGDRYDVGQISIRKVTESSVVREYRDDAGEYKVFFDAEVKYLDSDTEEKCYRDFEVEVRYDNDKEEPIFSID